VQFGPQWQGEVADLRRLRWLRDVEQIVFEGPQVTDEWIRHLQGMRGLSFLKIRRASITNAALETLKDLPRLRYVKLLYLEIGDGAVEHLRQCKQIARLLVYGTDVTEEGAQQLKAAGLDVDLRKGAFLGISVPPANDRENWYINQVTPNSAAERSGLEPGDVITRFGEHPVRDFPSLMALISTNDAGDVVTVEVQRRGETLIKQITLGEWE
jgi:membrane-associated protease RseP (regulator of RpoE activity)